MKLSNLFNDDKAGSPVLGVILMVAITVILAAVIGTFVLGLGDSISDTTPSASISGDIDYDDNGNATVTFTHESGQNIDADDLRISDSGDKGFDRDSVEVSGDQFTAGESISTSTDDIESDGTVRLVFDSGSTSSTLASVDYEADEFNGNN